MKKKTPALRLPPPRNSNEALNAQHCLYVGRTGSGKTSAVKRLPLLPKASQAVFFDPYQNYAGKKFKGQTVVQFSEFAPFVKALSKARKTKGGFKIALVKPPTAENVELFAQIIWSMGDGKKPPLYACIEELATASDTAGKLKGVAGELWRGGRQYGLHIHSTFQRMQEVPKTVISSSPIWWIGGADSVNDAIYISKARGVPVEDVTALKVPEDNNGIAEYLIVKSGVGNVTKGEIDCKK